MQIGNLVFDIFLLGSISILTSYLIFASGEYYFGEFPNRRPLRWANIGVFFQSKLKYYLSPQGTWGRKNRTRISLLMLILPILAAVLIFIFKGEIAGGFILLTPFAILPRMYFRVSKNDKKSINAILPTLIVNLRSLLADGETSVDEAFNLAIASEEGPLYEHLREELLRTAVGYSFKEAMRRAAEYYDQPNFHRLVSILVDNEFSPDMVDQQLEVLERSIHHDLRAAVSEMIASRFALMLVAGSVALLPALLLTLLFPAIYEFVAGGTTIP